ncbi:hypothetical protein KUTeg_001558 [Tegillarca granosa]|uniref:Uncharacterized protein n=1 Tax=Tegillarca granosa TaxID=220873 RepID=A0ABQ9FRT2_TEGGR|nr:hypothetical protein KUTeg_001558 [Tegillarca granosa]
MNTYNMKNGWHVIFATHGTTETAQQFQRMNGTTLVNEKLSVVQITQIIQKQDPDFNQKPKKGNSKSTLNNILNLDFKNKGTKGNLKANFFIIFFYFYFFFFFHFYIPVIINCSDGRVNQRLRVSSLYVAGFLLYKVMDIQSNSLSHLIEFLDSKFEAIICDCISNN